MNTRFRLLAAMVMVLAVVAGATSVASAQTPVPTPPAPTATTPPGVPAGFRQIASAPGVALYQKDYPNGSPDYVQVVDLSLGAQVELLHGDITEARPRKGSFGGPDPRMKSPAIQTYWNQISQQEPQAFCVINGSFFYMPEYPTRLAFPLKKDGQMVTEGWGIDTHVGKQLILELWNGAADIKMLSQDSLYNSDAPDILGGLAEDANKRIKASTGRTFTGVDDRDGDGVFETVLFLTTRTAYQSGAASVLRDFGANKVMMLDGGGSTQLLCRSGHYLRSDRPIPQALAIIAAEPQAVAAQVARHPAWQVLVAGEPTPFQLEIRNTGVQSWPAQDTQFLLDAAPLAAAQWLPLAGEVLPGATAILSDTLPALTEPGVHLLQIGWSVAAGDTTLPDQHIGAPVVVLPAYLADRQGELATLLQQWGSRPVDEVQGLVEEWLANNPPPVEPTATPGANPDQAALSLPTDLIRPEDIIWIPLLMLPIIILLGFLIGRRPTV